MASQTKSATQIHERIHWLGHDTFRIDAEKTIYIDPYQILPGRPADLILITHAHYDHCSPEDVAKIRGPGTIIITEKEAAEKLQGDVRVLAPGESVEVHGVKVSAVPAYNIDKKFHPRENGWLGFVIEVGGERIYHAGDTDFIEEMSDIEADVALLPVSGTYVMTAGEAAQAALAIKPKLAIPMHYGTVVGGPDDAEAFAQELKGKIEVLILQVQKATSS